MKTYQNYDRNTAKHDRYNARAIQIELYITYIISPVFLQIHMQRLQAIHRGAIKF